MKMTSKQHEGGSVSTNKNKRLASVSATIALTGHAILTSFLGGAPLLA